MTQQQTKNGVRGSRPRLDALAVLMGALALAVPVSAKVSLKVNNGLQVEGTGTSFENCQSPPGRSRFDPGCLDHEHLYFNSFPTFEAAAVSVWENGQLANSVTIESAELDAGTNIALLAFNANVIVRLSEILSIVQLRDGFASFRFCVLPINDAFEGTGQRGCMRATRRL